jgi:hypothetical protein
LKIVGIILAVLALAAGGFWFLMLRAPSAESVCENIAKLMEKETGGAMKQSDAERAKCVERFSNKPENAGLIPWAKQLKCARDAQSVADLKACKS